MIEPNKSEGPETETRPSKQPRWRKELTLGAVCVGFGLIVLPALIYLVGVPILGAYGGGPHIGAFYGDYFRNLIAGVGRTWFLVVGPYILLVALRLMFWRWRSKLPVNQPPSDDDVAQSPVRKERREPFVAP
jgi:hypothetical protein